MTIGEHYSVKLFGDYLGEAFLNTFAYRQTAGIATNSAQQLSTQFDSSVLFDLADSVGDQTNYTRLEVFAIETPSDYSDVVPANSTGTRVFSGGTLSPSWVAFGFRSNRAGAGTRASYKRFCGLGEVDVTENSLASTFISRASVIALRAALSQTLAFVGGNTWVPVQLLSGWTPGSSPTENFGIIDYGIAYLTSQVSRRP